MEKSSSLLGLRRWRATTTTLRKRARTTGFGARDWSRGSVIRTTAPATTVTPLPLLLRLIPRRRITTTSAQLPPLVRLDPPPGGLPWPWWQRQIRFSTTTAAVTTITPPVSSSSTTAIPHWMGGRSGIAATATTDSSGVEERGSDIAEVDETAENQVNLDAVGDLNHDNHNDDPSHGSHPPSAAVTDGSQSNMTATTTTTLPTVAQLTVDTMAWLRDTQGSPDDFAQARYLLEQWMRLAAPKEQWKKTANSSSSSSSLELENVQQHARCATLILQRWVHDLVQQWEQDQETQKQLLRQPHSSEQQQPQPQQNYAQNQPPSYLQHHHPDELASNRKDLYIVRELFHRTMFLWQRTSLHAQQLQQEQNNHHHRQHPQQRQSAADQHAIQLLQTMHHASQTMASRIVRPGPRSYSMLWEILQRSTLIEQDPYAVMKQADALMEQLLQRKINPATPQHLDDNPYKQALLRAQNSYLHLLAKCSAATVAISGSDHNQNSAAAIAIAQHAERFVRNVMEYTDGHTYAALLQAWSHHDPVRTAQLWHNILEQHDNEDSGMVSNRVCYNICIRALANAGRVTEAEDWLWRMNDHFLATSHPEAQPDASSFLAVLHGYAQCHNPTRALELLQHMLVLPQNDPRYDAHALRPTTAHYNVVLDAHARTLHAGPVVEELLHNMEQLYARGELDAGPSRRSYAIAIRSWGQTPGTYDAPDRATELLRQMQELASPNNNNNNGRRGRDLAPNTVVYTSLIQAWAQSGREEGGARAVTIFRYMLANAPQQPLIRPNTLTLNAVLNALARRRQADEAYDLLQEMVTRCITDVKPHDVAAVGAVRPNTICWITVITAHRGHPQGEARTIELVSQLEDLYDHSGGDVNLKPTPALYAAALMTLGPTLVHVAETMVWSMNDRYRKRHDPPLHPHNELPTLDPPNTHLCNTLLGLWSRSDDPVAPQRAEHILGWMMTQNHGCCTPDARTLNYLVQTWNRSQRRTAPERLQQLVTEVQARYPHLGPSMTTRNATATAGPARGHGGESTTVDENSQLQNGA